MTTLTIDKIARYYSGEDLCIHCHDPLVIGENWTEGRAKSKYPKRICRSCQHDYDVGYGKVLARLRRERMRAQGINPKTLKPYAEKVAGSDFTPKYANAQAFISYSMSRGQAERMIANTYALAPIKEELANASVAIHTKWHDDDPVANIAGDNWTVLKDFEESITKFSVDPIFAANLKDQWREEATKEAERDIALIRRIVLYGVSIFSGMIGLVLGHCLGR